MRKQTNELLENDKGKWKGSFIHCSISSSIRKGSEGKITCSNVDL